MADEIRVSMTRGDDIYLVYVIPIAPQIRVADDNGANYAPTTWDSVSESAQAVLLDADHTVVTQAEVDNGEYVIEESRIRGEPGMSGADLLALARDRYGIRKAYWLTDDGTGAGHYAALANYHQHVGKAFNE